MRLGVLDRRVSAHVRRIPTRQAIIAGVMTLYELLRLRKTTPPRAHATSLPRRTRQEPWSGALRLRRRPTRFALDHARESARSRSPLPARRFRSRGSRRGDRAGRPSNRRSTRLKRARRRDGSTALDVAMSGWFVIGIACRISYRASANGAHARCASSRRRRLGATQPGRCSMRRGDLRRRSL